MQIPRGPVARIACIGEGMIVLVPTEPGPLEEVDRFERGIGGAEVNVALGLAWLGVAVSWLGRVGDDGFGRHLTRTLASRGVDVSAVEVDPSRKTGLYVKEVAGSVTRMHYYRSGSAASALTPSYLVRPATRSVLTAGTLVHTSGITTAISPTARRTVEALAAPGRRHVLSYDANWRAVLWQGREDEGRAAVAAMLRAADVAFVGADEAQVLFGTDRPEDVRRELPGPTWLVVKNGSGVATGFCRAERADADALPADVVDPIGAGDAFAAGFLAAVVNGEPLTNALSGGHASAVGVLTTSQDHA